jgi:hypothetical protein
MAASALLCQQRNMFAYTTTLGVHASIIPKAKHLKIDNDAPAS